MSVVAGYTDLYQFGEDPEAIKKPESGSVKKRNSDPDPQQSGTPNLDPCSDSLSYFYKKISPSGKLYVISWSYLE